MKPDELKLLTEVFEERIPFNRLLGLKVVELDVASGQCVTRLPYRPELIGDFTRPALHGGVISAACDAVGGFTVMAQLGGLRDRSSTVDLLIDYLRPGEPAEVVFRSQLVRLGRSIAVATIGVWQGERHVAQARGAYNVIRRELDE